MFDGDLHSRLRVTSPSRLELDDADPINRGLVGFWPLNEPGTGPARDIGPFRGHGTSATMPSGGNSPWLRARTFNGSSQYITTGTPLAARPLTAMTCAAWVKSTRVPPHWERVADTGFSGGFAMGLQATTGVVFYGSWGGNLIYSTTVVGNANKWHLLSITFKATGPGTSATALYVDGKVEATGTSLGYLEQTLPMLLGFNSAGGTEYFGGQMSLARYWSRALTPPEHRELYRRRLAGAIDPAERLFFATRSITQPLSSTITAGTLSLTASLTAELAADGGLSGSHRRRGRYKVWQDVPAELQPVVSLAENYADADAVERAVDAALAKYARQMARASIARRNTLLEELKQSIVNAVERAAEADDEEALLALM